MTVTALAPTALEAETLAKAALLSGPRDGARAARRARRRPGPRRRRRGARRAAGTPGGEGRMIAPDPLHYGWWLAGRASGIVALALVTLSVGIGLAMAGRVASPPRALAHADGAARARGPRGPRGDRRPRRHPAARPLAASRAGRHRWCRSPWATARSSAAWASSPPTWPRCSGSRSTRAGASGRGCGARRTARPCSSTSSASSTPSAPGTDASTPWLRAFLLVTGVPIVVLFVHRLRGRRPARVTRPAAEGAVG